ncbi:MAG: GntR family transcriptional regulator [Burkholderiaceae bacterium]
MNLDSYAAEFPHNSPTVTELVVQALRRAILEGALEGGATIRQEDVARQFGVSRVPVREALLKLEGEGLVETLPRRGVVVTMLSTEGFEEILEMRIALESLALERAAPRFTLSDTNAALELVQAARDDMLASANPDANKELASRWGDMNWEFHRRLYAPADRPRLLASIENLQQLFARHLRMRMSVDWKITSDGKSAGETPRKGVAAANLREWATVLKEHEQLLRACSRHDAAGAITLLKHHIADHGAQLLQRLRED